jgi:hypothetical protein
MTESNSLNLKTAYIDFDGVLFYSTDEPLYSALLAFGFRVEPDSINKDWCVSYNKAKQSIANQSDLYNFLLSIVGDDIPREGLNESLFRQSLLAVRESHVISGAYKHLFRPTEFCQLLGLCIHNLNLDICILTNRDHSIASALCHDYLSMDLRIASLGLAHTSKLEYIISETVKPNAIFIDDVYANLILPRSIDTAGILRIQALWGYGNTSVEHHRYDNLFKADCNRAIRYLTDFAKA